MTLDINDRALKWVQIIIGILFIISVALNIWLLTKENKFKVVEKTVVRIERDTIHDTVPEIKYEKVIALKHDTLKVVELLPGDTIPGDTVRVIAEVPISQKEYSDDSTYRAWVSGYKPNLDSIDIYKKTVYIDHTITKTKKQRFVIGPQVGVGYDVKNKNFAPTVGVGVTYNLFGF